MNKINRRRQGIALVFHSNPFLEALAKADDAYWAGDADGAAHWNKVAERELAKAQAKGEPA